MHVRDASIARLPANAEAQKSFDSPASRAASAGRWITRTPLPFPRSEMAAAAAWNGRMHVVGGYGNLRVDRAYHHIYDAAKNSWSEAAALPRGASHIGVATLNGMLYAIGGFVEQNRLPHDDAFVFDIGTGEWRAIAPLPRARAAACVVALSGKIHVIAGASGRDIKKSVDWHEVYDPATDNWEMRAPLPDPRDHAGAELLNGRIHVIGGGFDGSNRNTGLHHVYDVKTDAWEIRAPLPTPRNGHATAVMREKIFVMGGESAGKIHGQNEGYDGKADRWESYAPLPTPRHGAGAVAIDNSIYFAGGAPVAGTTFLTSVNEAFTLA